jgi:tetratricopeptide (TPR) repeat protein
LSRNLDGFEGLRTVDPGTILSAVGKSGSGPLDSDRARSVARRVGAGLYVTGSVHAAGGQLRIQAQLYDGTKGTPGEALAQASVDGGGGDVFRLMDQLASRLIVATTRRGATHRLIETAALTTTSLPALKEYLNAEAALRAGDRAGSAPGSGRDTAIAGFQRALDQDSTFALAYYRLAVAAGWRDRHDLASWATGRALAVSDRMVERDRRLLSAYAAFRRGAVDSAESFYRGLLRDYPDDLEAQFQLADLLYQYNPLRGHARSEARELFDAVLAYDPGFL